MLNKLLLGVATVALLTGCLAKEEAKAQEAAGMAISLESDTIYSIENEAFSSTMTVGAGIMGVGLSSEFAFDLDNQKYDGVILGAEYGVDLFGLGLTPYAEYSLDGDSEHVDTVVGLKVTHVINF